MDELRHDPHTVTRTLHCPLDDPIHIQLTRDLGQRLLGVPVLHGL
jgi:hypothetical protein